MREPSRRSDGDLGVVLAVPAEPTSELIAPHAPRGSSVLAGLRYASVAQTALAEIKATQLAGGISKQPAYERYPGQVEDADNVVFSVADSGTFKSARSLLKEVGTHAKQCKVVLIGISEGNSVI